MSDFEPNLQREMQNALARIGSHLDQTHAGVRDYIELLAKENSRLYQETEAQDDEITRLRRELQDAYYTVADAVALGRARYPKDFLTCSPWCELHVREIALGKVLDELRKAEVQP